MNLENKIRVCIRGMSGLLGSRLALAIGKQPDMVLTAGIVKNDQTLSRLLQSPEDYKLPEKLYLDEPHRIVREINSSQSMIRFEPADQLNLSRECDAVIDTAAQGTREKWNERYSHFKGPILLQSGEYPAGTLIAPPLMENKNNGNLYRQGDCILSGIIPVLASLESLTTAIRVSILMQYSERLADYPTDQRINATYTRDDLASQIKNELDLLQKGKNIVMEGVLQVPGLDYYTATLHFDTNNYVTGADLKEIFENTPRVMVAPHGITSTYEIDHLLREPKKSLGKDISPIVVYDNDLDFVNPAKNDIRVRVAIYSRLIAVLPNIDSIRMLMGRNSPFDAMSLTDKYAGFGMKLQPQQYI